MATFEVALERVERPSASGKAYAVERGVVAPRGAAAGRALMTCAPYAAVVRRELAGEVCAETFRRLRAGEGVEASSSSSGDGERGECGAAFAIRRDARARRGERERIRRRGGARGAAREVCRRTRFEWCFSASLDETRRREATFRESGTRCWARMGFEACWRYTRDRRPRRPTGGVAASARKVRADTKRGARRGGARVRGDALRNHAGGD